MLLLLMMVKSLLVLLLLLCLLSLGCLLLKRVLLQHEGVQLILMLCMQRSQAVLLCCHQ